MKKYLLTGLCAGILMGLSAPAIAHENNNHQLSVGSSGLRADDHAPIGVMRDHMHKKGEWMLSYRYMRMHMEDNRDGTDGLSPEEIATTVPNRFFGTPGQPPTLRVVPTEMTTDMHMFGAMVAPADWMTLMLMGHYIDRDMDHITFAGGAGTTRLGTFSTEAKGWGDTSVSALLRLYEDSTHHLQLNAGLSLPTGSIKERDTVLTPMGAFVNLRLPYAMQLGSGTYDFLPGITYYGRERKWGWGAQYAGTIHMGENSQNYTRGDKHMVTAWGSYLWTNAISTSLRVTGETESDIDGIDSMIIAPVQTADPDNYGGERVSLSLGVNAVVPSGFLKGHRFSIEATAPVYQDLNGPQLERDHTIILGWSKAF
jgi:hypothetical protein